MEDRKAEGMIVVFGAGRQGECLISGLKKLGHKVFAVDQSISDNIKGMISSMYCSGVDLQDYEDIDFALEDIEDVDLVISCLPYNLNFKIVLYCIDREITYFDLGGHVETSRLINEYSEQNDGLVFTDIGLAPGWVNILAEECYRKLNKIDEVKRIEMYCGGLPLNKAGLDNPPFCYGRTWSSEGLLNEYMNDCFVLEFGKIKTVPGMSGVQNHPSGYESFYTSGGIGKTLHLMKKRGVQFCLYKTLRSKGHIEAVKTLIEAGFGSDFFDKLFPVVTKDYVTLEAKAYGKRGTYTINNIVIYSDDTFTAMQKCTAYPVAAIADLYINNVIIDGQYNPNCFDYSDVPYVEFTKILSELLGEDL